jgi:hypothetical protein
VCFGRVHNKPTEQLGTFMTTAAQASPIDSRVGHSYEMGYPYLVGREKLRE